MAITIISAGGPSYDQSLNTGDSVTFNSVTLPNYTQVLVGSFDNGTGGANGISLLCAVGYELNWQGGRLRSIMQGDESATPQAIYCDSALQWQGEGGNVTVEATGITFPDDSVQASAFTSVQADELAAIVAALVPPAIDDLAGVAGDTEATLTWTAPTVLDQTPITDYEVEFSDDNGDAWTPFADGVSDAPGAVVDNLTNDTEYLFRVRAINAIGAGEWAVSDGVTPVEPPPGVNVDYLVAAGGGGGGAGLGGGGGGGAGGLKSGVFYAESGTEYFITVGAGGAGGAVDTGLDGDGSSLDAISTTGGGGGGGNVTDGLSGGSGGGGPPWTTAPNHGLGVAGEGYDGGDGDTGGPAYGAGGGGGASLVGGNASSSYGGDGGAGVTWYGDTYAGGGGGGSNSSGSPAGVGGTGGGGDGGADAFGIGGVANTGGGGGGSGSAGRAGAAGGSGVVIIRAPQAAAATTGSPTVTTDGGTTIYTFTGSGSITF